VNVDEPIFLEKENEALEEVSYDESNLDIYVEEGPDGCVVLKGIPSMPGVLTYRGAAFNRPEPQVRILLTEEIISEDEAQLPNLIVTDGHKGFVTKKNAKKLSSGHVSETIERVEVGGKKTLKVKLVITDDVFFKKIQQKKVRGLSLGYRRTVDWTPVDHPVYGKIDGTYTSRQLNHLAGVENARSSGAEFTEDSEEVLSMTPEEIGALFKQMLDTFKIELLEALKPPPKQEEEPPPKKEEEEPPPKKEETSMDENDLMAYADKRAKLIRAAEILKLEVSTKDKNALVAAKLTKHWGLSLDGSEETVVANALAYISIHESITGKPLGEDVIPTPTDKKKPVKPLFKGR
jgi:hypothetical protein